MQPTLRLSTFAVVLTLSVAGGACSSENPASSLAAPSDAPHLDGGVTLGSGSRGSGDDESNTTTAADSGSTGRGGVTLGSGS